MGQGSPAIKSLAVGHTHSLFTATSRPSVRHQVSLSPMGYFLSGNMTRSQWWPFVSNVWWAEFLSDWSTDPSL